ncbi:alpha/beta hydrolase fold domain-containing protein [Kitasatospora sp. NPDC051853]|uniref:alpha/beta hydrolase fold domain-containing protein n=1 Tax=Kitasatospora sp. NPDC051853 TaxID=3364058 RepID=UPI0037B37755
MNRHLARLERHGTGRARRPWLITTSAVLLGLLAVLFTVLMTVPVPSTVTALATLGLDGAQLLTLVALLAAVVLAVLARRRRAGAAGWIASASAALMLVMTVVPAVALSRTAAAEGVGTSVASYLSRGLSFGKDRPADARTHTYATVDGTELKLDALPARRGSGTQQGSGPRPAVVYVHGGGWKIGGREDGYPWGRWFTDRGYDVFTIDYRLLPHADWRSGVGDVKAAVGWVRDNAGTLGVDPARISLFGESAGGHLALMAAYTEGDPVFPPTEPHRDTSVRTVLSFYGTTDFDDAVANSTAPDLIRRATREYVGGTKEQQPERWYASSPVHHVRPGLPPTLSVHGEDDRLIPVSQSRLLGQALAGAGVEHRTVELPWSSHLFDLTRGNLATQISAGVIEQFQQQYAN